MTQEQGVIRVRRPRRSAEAIQQLVEEFRISGLSQVEFCRQRGVGLSTLHRYVKMQRERQLAGFLPMARRKTKGRGATQESTASKGHKLEGKFLAVEVSSPIRPAETRKALVVVLAGGRKIEVSAAFDARLLAQLVAVLERME